MRCIVWDGAEGMIDLSDSTNATAFSSWLSRPSTVRFAPRYTSGTSIPWPRPVLSTAEIAEACALLKAEGALAARMTGSGSAVFGVFRSPSAAEKAFQRISPRYRSVFLCHTQHDSVRIMEE